MKIFKDSVIYLLGEMAAKALPFLLLPYLTHKLGAAGFGELSYYQTFFALFVLLLGFSQDGAVARYYYRYGHHLLHTIVFTAHSYTLIWTFIGLLISAYFSSPLFAILIAAACFQSLLTIQLSLRQCQKQALSYVQLQTLSGILVSLLTIVLLEYTSQDAIFYRFSAIFLGNAFIVAWAYFRFQNQPSRPLKPQHFLLSLQYLFTFGLPLLLHNISGLLKGQFDRFFIFHHYTPQELGVYSAAFQTASILGILLLAINKALVPHYFQALKNKLLTWKKIQKIMFFSLLFTPIPTLFALLLPESLFLWLLGEPYIGIKFYICLFLFGFSLTIPYYILVNYLFYHAKNGMITQASLLSTLVYLLSLLIIVPLDLHYAPLAMIIGNILIIPLLYWQISKLPQ